MDIFQSIINQAIGRGVAEETIVLLLLLPLVATFVSVARYLIGIRGLGIFTPVMLAAVLWATDVGPGLFLFLVMVAIVSLARLVLKKIRLHYLARMALLFWFIAITALIALIEFELSLVPLLILILITQDFIKVQLAKSWRIAVQLSGETFVLALAGLALLAWQPLQQLALAQPEIMILGPAILNLLIGRFTGMRLLEYQRFGRLLK